VTTTQKRTRTAIFVDANQTMADEMDRLLRGQDLDVRINRDPDIRSDDLPRLLRDAEIAIIDHTALPTEIAGQCPRLKHVVFLGTGARSYMNPEGLDRLGISVHTVKGYGDTAVAECAFGLMWASAKDFGVMDRATRQGDWSRRNGLQLTGKTLGLVGFGGIAAELARLARGARMKVVAWNRSPKTVDGIAFLDLETLLRVSDVVSLHLLLTDETRGILSRERLSLMRPEGILINTARGALVDEAAMIEALQAGKLHHAGLDVFTTEPLPANHPLTRLPNVTLSAHSAFRTAEANRNLLAAALDHCRRVSRCRSRASGAVDDTAV
jgi:D-3-phosphoglycerate dehydrogenase / 2-oxoglutarate reductase